MRKLITFVMLLFCALSSLQVVAQTETETITADPPNVIGMRVPVAAAALNAAGWRVGDYRFEALPNGSNNIANTISAQVITDAEAQTITLTVVVQPNMRLVYDNNEITLVSDADPAARFRLSDLLFESTLNDELRQFSAQDWKYPGTGTPWNGALDNVQLYCMQLWSILRGGASRITECTGERGSGHPGIQVYFETINSSKHFWIHEGIAGEFAIYQDSILRGNCPTTDNSDTEADDQCTFYLAPGLYAGDVTDYLYFSYNQDTFNVLNRSDERWMPLGQAVIENGITLGENEWIDYQGVIANPAALAPGQCLQYRDAEVPDDSSLPCEARVTTVLLPADRVFWRTEFRITSPADRQTRTCPPPAADGSRTICIIPR